MSANQRQKFNAKKWVEGEIEAMIDLYENTDAEAAKFVGDLLGENEYREELADAQVRAAIAYLARRKRPAAV